MKGGFSIKPDILAHCARREFWAISFLNCPAPGCRIKAPARPDLLATRQDPQHVFKNMPKLDTQFITFFCPILQDRDVKCR